MGLHGWEYDFALKQYCCMDPAIFPMDSGQWCFPGCGIVVTELELLLSRLPTGSFLHISLDNLAYLNAPVG